MCQCRQLDHANRWANKSTPRASRREGKPRLNVLDLAGSAINQKSSARGLKLSPRCDGRSRSAEICQLLCSVTMWRKYLIKYFCKWMETRVSLWLGVLLQMIPAYPDFMYQTGLLDEPQRDYFAKQCSEAIDLINQKKWREAADVLSLLCFVLNSHLY